MNECLDLFWILDGRGRGVRKEEDGGGGRRFREASREGLGRGWTMKGCVTMNEGGERGTAVERFEGEIDAEMGREEKGKKSEVGKVG